MLAACRPPPSSKADKTEIVHAQKNGNPQLPRSSNNGQLTTYAEEAQAEALILQRDFFFDYRTSMAKG